MYVNESLQTLAKCTAICTMIQQVTNDIQRYKADLKLIAANPGAYMLPDRKIELTKKWLAHSREVHDRLVNYYTNTLQKLIADAVKRNYPIENGGAVVSIYEPVRLEKVSLQEVNY